MIQITRGQLVDHFSNGTEQTPQRVHSLRSVRNIAPNEWDGRGKFTIVAPVDRAAVRMEWNRAGRGNWPLAFFVDAVFHDGGINRGLSTSSH